MRRLGIYLGIIGALGSSAGAQVLPDRADPALVTRSLPAPPAKPVGDVGPVGSARPAATVAPLAGPVRVARIVVAAGDIADADGYTRIVAPYVGRSLSRDDLVALAGAVAGAARARGLILATASIRPETTRDGVLTVDLDEGRVDAVRSLGATNPAADRLLSSLVTHHAATRAELERTLLLVGDLPGVTVVSTRYARENGFGILLVTLAFDRVTLFAQGDNRGTHEIGPWRTTELANIRRLATAGDELGLVASQTPANPREFEFVSGRYVAPVGRGGTIIGASAFYGATHAGGDLRSLDLTGRSYGGGVAASFALRRSRAASLWFDVDIRALENRQRLRGTLFRADTLSILSGTLRTDAKFAGGTLRGGVTATWGLPIPGVTRPGDPLASRPDGDARFGTLSVQGEWRRTIVPAVSVLFAGVAQAATRPLLATAQISLGGPVFGRAYDYSERSGDDGVLGSLELQLDVTKLHHLPLPRVQLYALADGGTVHALRNGPGGGTLGSGGAGLRVGKGPFDAGVEVALPLAADRIATGDRSPRVSFRLSVFL